MFNEFVFCWLFCVLLAVFNCPHFQSQTSTHSSCGLVPETTIHSCHDCGANSSCLPQWVPGQPQFHMFKGPARMSTRPTTILHVQRNATMSARPTTILHVLLMLQAFRHFEPFNHIFRKPQVLGTVKLSDLSFE